MHQEILSPEQIRLLPFVRLFSREYYLVGGTAIALYIGHRRSIDFDLFKFNPIRPKAILDRISEQGYSHLVTRRVIEQLNVSIGEVKFTFFQYPYQIDAPVTFENILRMPELIDLAAMKAFALGRRSKWKDYIDLYFLIRDRFTITQISERANQLYGQLFNEKLFRAQLSYFDDIDYTESIEYRVQPVPDEEIRGFLIDQATDIW